MSDNTVTIKGNQYKYAYDPTTRGTKYLGPVGSAPALTEQEFLEEVGVIRDYQDSFRLTYGNLGSVIRVSNNLRRNNIPHGRQPGDLHITMDGWAFRRARDEGLLGSYHLSQFWTGFPYGISGYGEPL